MEIASTVSPCGPAGHPMAPLRPLGPPWAPYVSPQSYGCFLLPELWAPQPPPCSVVSFPPLLSPLLYLCIPWCPLCLRGQSYNHAETLHALLSCCFRYTHKECCPVPLFSASQQVQTRPSTSGHGKLSESSCMPHTQHVPESLVADQASHWKARLTSAVPLSSVAP